MSWLETSSSSNTKPVLELLERATRTFVFDTRYRNDVRYVELWIAYADLLPEPADVFKFMHSNRIGEDVALFYMAWSWVAETANNFVLADKIYKRGTALRAVPPERLAPRYAQFQRRMYRRTIDTLTADAKAAATRAGAPEPKVDLISLTAAAAVGLTGAAIVASRDENGHAADAPRAALGRITASAAARLHRPTSYADDGAYRDDADALHAASSSVPAVRQGQSAAVAGLRPATALPSVAPPRSNVSIPIFEDEGFSEVNAALPAPFADLICTADELGVQRPLQVLEARGVSVPWTEFGTEAGRRKENSEAPAKWSEAGPLPQHAGVRPSSSFAMPLWAQREPAAAAIAARAYESGGGRIQIFADDEPAAAPAAPAARAPLALPPSAPRPAPFSTIAPMSALAVMPFLVTAATDGSSFEELRALAWARAHPTDAAFIASCIPKIANGILHSVYVQAPALRETARRAAAAADARVAAAVAAAVASSTPAIAVASSEVAKAPKTRAMGASLSAGNRRQTFAAPTGELLRRYGYDAPASGVAVTRNATLARGGDSTAELPSGLRFSSEESVAGLTEATARLSTLDELFAKGNHVSSAPTVASPVGPSNFSPAALASSRGPRESMLNRLFEDVDDEEAPLGRGRSSLPLDASDVSSIAGDGMTYGGVAVTENFPFPVVGFVAAQPSAAFAIFSDFTTTTAVAPMVHVPATVLTAVDTENAPKAITRALPPAPNATTSVSLFKVGPRSVARESSTFEDVTLHTRLAMDDLDGLFASPRRAPAVAAASAVARVAFAFAAPVPVTSNMPAPVAAAPPPPPPIATAVSPVADIAAGLAAVPAKRARALPPDARRLSMGFSLSSRRQSGIGGRASLSLMPPPPTGPLGGGATFTILEEDNQSSAVAKKPLSVAASLTAAASIAAAASLAAAARTVAPDNYDIENSLGRAVPRASNGLRVLGPSATAHFEPLMAQEERAAHSAAAAYAGLSGVRHPHHADNQFLIAEDE